MPHHSRQAGEAQQLYLMGWRIDCTALHPAYETSSVSVLPGLFLEICSNGKVMGQGIL